MVTFLTACGGSKSGKSSPPDTTASDIIPPVITLNGDSKITLFLNEIYTDLGANALDEKDGATEVVIEYSINTHIVGSYIVTSVPLIKLVTVVVQPEQLR